MGTGLWAGEVSLQVCGAERQMLAEEQEPALQAGAAPGDQGQQGGVADAHAGSNKATGKERFQSVAAEQSDRKRRAAVFTLPDARGGLWQVRATQAVDWEFRYPPSRLRGPGSEEQTLAGPGGDRWT